MARSFKLGDANKPTSTRTTSYGPAVEDRKKCHKKTDTAQLMMQAATELRQVDPAVARTYETYRGSAYSYCPKCGRSMEADIESKTAACTGCGTVVQLPSKSTSVPAYSRTDSSKKQYSICMRCGAKIRGNTKICKNCESARPHEIPLIH
jgi:hypothetical protein